MIDTTSIIFTPTVRDDAIEITGSAAPVDLELLFKLLHLHFTAPRADTVAFRRFQERAASFARGRTVDPDAIFADSVAAITTQYNARAAERHALARLGQPGQGVGVLERAHVQRRRVRPGHDGRLRAGSAMRPLIALAISASLPAGTPERVRDTGARFLTASSAGTSRPVWDRSRTQIVSLRHLRRNSDANTQLNTATELAELALTDRLREPTRRTYNASVGRVSPSDAAVPLRDHHRLRGVARPHRPLTTAAIAELNRLRTTGPTDGEFDKVRAAKRATSTAKPKATATGRRSWHGTPG
jgi:zinc protease